MQKLDLAVLAAATAAAFTAPAATNVSGDFLIDRPLDSTGRPLVITGDANITVASEVDTFLGAVTNNGHTVTINLESGSKAQVSWFTVRGGGTTTIHFNGGALTDAGGWDNPWFDTAEGSAVALVSVDGNPIRVTQPNAVRKYWNRNRGGGTPGRVTTSGSGRCDLLSSGMQGSSKIALMLCGCSTSDWGHTGGTYFGHYSEASWGTGYVWCNEADVLPPGDIYLGTENGLSPVELNIRAYSQSVERLHLQNTHSAIIRESSAVALNFTGANAGIVSAAATTPSFSVPALVVAAGASLTVDHVAVTATSSFANFGTIAYANGGSLTASLGIASDTICLSADKPITGASAIVKSGAGTYSYAGDAALDVDALTVNGGEFRLSGPRGTTNRWWKFIARQGTTAGGNLHISLMRLFGNDKKPADGGAGDPENPPANGFRQFSSSSGAASTFEPYNYSLTSPSGSITFKTSGSIGSGGTAMEPRIIWYYNTDVHACEITSPKPNDSNSSTWITWTYRIPNGRPIYGYNLARTYYLTYVPRYWTLQSSPDGVTWETMDSQDAYSVPALGGYWYNNGGRSNVNPTNLIEFASQVRPTLPTAGGLASDANIKVASGATFDASLVTGGQEISSLIVDYAGGGTLKGVKFASSGTVHLQNVPAGTDLNEHAVPLTFGNVVGTPSLANWTAVIHYANGVVREKKVAWEGGVLRIRSAAFMIVVR